MRILIIGNGGTGKSTLADKLSKRFSIPVTHLDLLSWKDNYERVPEDEFRTALLEAMKHDDMIIEGWAYHSTMLQRLKWADLIIYLKYPLEYCLEVVRNRNKEFNNRTYPFDPFTGERLSKQSLYDEAVTRVHEKYEPEVDEWLDLPEMENKFIFRICSITQLNERYESIAELFKQQKFNDIH